ncbi:MAG: dTDP-4-dehydrorhamnose reductase [Oceanicoccus sp.]|jgi:dTDP-4-dehydrorhamnose reductase
MKVLLIAQEGQIREALEAQFFLRGRAFVAVGMEYFETDANLALTLPVGIGVVVNALDLELLQQHPLDNLMTDLLQLVQACQQMAVPLIQLSTSRVFDGGEGGRYRELDDVVPVSDAAVMSFRMEELLRGSLPQHIILRTGPVFSHHSVNLLTQLLARFQKNESLLLSTTEKSCPMHSMDLARVVSAIIDQLSCGCDSWGTYHYTSSDPASAYEFAETVLAVASQYAPAIGQPMMIEPTASANSDWARPLLNCDKIFRTFGIKQLPWRAFVVPTVKNIFQPDVSEESINGQ